MTAVVTLTDSEIQRAERRPTGDEGRGIPAWKITVNYRKNYTQQQGGELAGAVDEGRRSELAKEYRQVTVEDTSVQARHPFAPSLTYDTLLVHQSAAQQEANRRKALYGVGGRLRFLIETDAELVVGVNLGDEVTIQMSRWGLAKGRNFRVIGMTENLASNRAELDLWG